jgi:mannose-6-phosphate isomerase-like protein (cupin superfamily)
MQNYIQKDLGNLANIINNEHGKAFLKDELQLTSCEISVNVLPAGAKLPFSHKHKQNEEIYIFLKGTGAMNLDDKQVDVQEGTCIKVLPKPSRTIVAKTDLQYICIQAKADSLEQWGMSDAVLC